MKKKIFTILLSLISVVAMADNVTISPVTIQPGGEYSLVTVSLADGQHIYTGFQMDITLPEGVEMYYYNGKPLLSMTKKDGIYPSTVDPIEETTTYTHSVDCTYGEVDAKILRITCTSSKNENFIATSGTLFRFAIKASTYAKPGAVTLGLSNCKFITYDKDANPTTVGYAVQQTAISGVTIGDEGTAALSLSGTTHWSTLVLPFSAAIPSGVSVYNCSRKNETVLILDKANKIEAFTPYIVYTESGYTGPLSGTVGTYPESGIVTKGYLSGALSQQSVTSGYVLQNGEDGVMFYNCNGNSFNIPAGKCWVTLPSSTDAKGYGFYIDETTGISQIENGKMRIENSAVYNISGQRVDASNAKGLVIANGKKILK